MHAFDQDISLTSRQPFSFRSNISDNWSVNGIPDGGYLMAIIANAMQQHSQKKSTPILTANFISRCTPGEAMIQVEPIIQSTQFDRLEGRLFQGGKEKVRMFGTFAKKKDECQVDQYEKSPPRYHLSKTVSAFRRCRITQSFIIWIYGWTRHALDGCRAETCRKNPKIKGGYNLKTIAPLIYFQSC